VPAAQAEQPLGQQQVEHSCHVDDKGHQAHDGELLGELVDLERQEDAGPDHGDVLAPTLEQEKAHALEQLEGGVGEQG